MSASVWKDFSSCGVIFVKAGTPDLAVTPTKILGRLPCEGSQSLMKTLALAGSNCSSDCGNIFDALIIQKYEIERQPTGDPTADRGDQAATFSAGICDVNTHGRQAAINSCTNYNKRYTSSAFFPHNAIRSDNKHSKCITEKVLFKKSDSLARLQVLQSAVIETPTSTVFKKERCMWSPSNLACDDKIRETNSLQAERFAEPLALIEQGSLPDDLYQNSLQFAVLKSVDAKWISGEEVSEGIHSGHKGIMQEKQSISCRAFPDVEQADGQTVQRFLDSLPLQAQQVVCSVPLQHENSMTVAVSHNQLGTVQHEPVKSSPIHAESFQDVEFQTTQWQNYRTRSPPGIEIFPVATSTPVSKCFRTRSATEIDGSQTDSGIALSFSSHCAPLFSSSERDTGICSSLRARSEKSGHLAMSHADSSNDNNIRNLTPDDSTDGGNSLNTSLSSMHWLKDFALGPKNSPISDQQTHSAPVVFTSATSIKGKAGSCKKQAELQSERNKRPPHTFVNLIKLALATRPLKGMKVKEICKWIEDKFPYYRHKANSGWKNSIRQNLSMYSCFVRVRAPYSKQPGSYWICKPDQQGSCTETSTNRSGLMPIVAAHPHLNPYTLLCLPNACCGAPLPGQMPCYISVPSSSSVGIPSSTGSNIPTHLAKVPVVLPAPKLPIPRMSTASLPPVCKSRTRASAPKTRTRKACTTRMKGARECGKSRKVEGGTDLVFGAWMQTQSDNEKPIVRDYIHTLSQPFRTDSDPLTRNDVGKTARKDGTHLHCFSEKVARSLDFCLSVSEGNLESSPQFKAPVSEEESSPEFEILSMEEDMLSKIQNRRKQVYPRHHVENCIVGSSLEPGIILTKDIIPDNVASQPFAIENSSDVKMPPRKKQKNILPVSPLLSSPCMEFMHLPHIPSVNSFDSKFDLAQQHNISSSPGEHLSKLPETSTPIRNGPALEPQRPQSSPVLDVLPQPLAGGLSPVNSSFFETMGDIFVSPSAHMSSFNPGKANNQNCQDAESMAGGSNGHLPELKTPPSRWSWAGVLSASVGHWGDSKDEMHPGQNLSHFFEGSNLMDMYEAPSFNLSPQHLHFKSGSPYNSNKTPGHMQSAPFQQTCCSDAKLLVHSRDLVTDFQRQNIGNNLGHNAMQPEAGRSTSDVARKLCYVSSNQCSTQTNDFEADFCVPNQVLSTNYQLQNMKNDLE